MKVAIYVSELNVRGGTHKQVLRLAQYLHNHNHEVQIITSCYDPSLGYPEFANFSVLTLGEVKKSGLIGRLLNRLKPACLAIKMSRVDIVNIHDNRGLLFGIVARIFRKGRRYVWQINDLDPAFKIGAHRRHERSSLREIRQRLANQFFARKVDAITVNVNKNRLRVAEYLKREATTLYCGVDFPEVEFCVKTTGNPFKLLSTGVFFPYRNYENLLAACASANRRLESENVVELIIVGDTRYNPGYVEKIRSLAMVLNVKLAIRENISQTELDELIADSNAFAFINVDQSWGLAVFEAAARSTPVILSKSVGATELVGDKSGFLMVDPLSSEEIANSIISLATNTEYLQSAAIMARDTVKDMSWEKLYCAPAEALFEQLLELHWRK